MRDTQNPSRQKPEKKKTKEMLEKQGKKTAKTVARHRCGAEPASETIKTMRKLPEQPPERRVRGEEVPNTVYLTPKLQKLPWPCAPDQCVVATHSCADGRVKLKYDG